MDSFEEYGKRAVEYAKARGTLVAVEFKGETETHAAASAWLDYWKAKGFHKAVRAFLPHLGVGKAISVPCLEPERFDPSYVRRYPRDWRPKPAPQRSLAERQALRAKLGLRVAA